jgi:hypothetical protein
MTQTANDITVALWAECDTRALATHVGNELKGLRNIIARSTGHYVDRDIDLAFEISVVMSHIVYLEGVLTEIVALQDEEASAVAEAEAINEAIAQEEEVEEK